MDFLMIEINDKQSDFLKLLPSFNLQSCQQENCLREFWTYSCYGRLTIGFPTGNSLKICREWFPRTTYWKCGKMTVIPILNCPLTNSCLRRKYENMRIKNQVILKSMLANHEQWLRYKIAWTCHERGTKKRFWVPMRNGTQTFWFLAPMLYHWATETLQWAKFMFVNRIREIVSFELGKEREKDVFYSTLVTRIKKQPSLLFYLQAWLY